MAGRVPQDKIEQIRAASDIVDIIGGYLPLKRAGGNFVALCPFHKEKTPSFNVNPQRQIYHCFGCHAGGDVFKFLQEYEHLEFIEVVKRLAERANIVLEFDQSPKADRARRQKDLLLKVHEQLAARWHGVLLNEAQGEPGRRYLAERGITEEAVKAFRLGFAPGAWEDTVNWAKAQGHDPRLMEESGLVASRDGRQYGRFRGRLMFPIADAQGKVIGFSGRVLEADVKAAKYVNSPETMLFHKSQIFYGLDKARREILKQQCAVVCEGQLDTIACHMAGITHVVAPQGTALTVDHARLLKRHAREVVLCFDSDTAGQNAAVRSYEALLEFDLVVSVMSVPEGHDPDSFIREHGADAFRQLMDGAPGFIDFYLSLLVAQNDVRTDAGRQAVVQAMGATVRRSKDAVLLDHCAQQVALAVGATAESVRAEFQRMPQPRSNVPREDVAPVVPSSAPEPVNPPSKQEEWLLRLVFYDRHFVDWASDCLDLRWVEHGQVRAILERAAATGATADELMPELDEGSRRLLSAVVADGSTIPDPGRQLMDVVVRLRDRHVDQRLAELTRLTAQPNLSEAKLLTVLEEQHELRAEKQSELPAVPTMA